MGITFLNSQPHRTPFNCSIITADQREMPMHAGFRKLEVHDPQGDARFPVVVLYPTDVASAPVAVGPYVWNVSVDAPLMRHQDQRQYPLVLLSHGSGGSPIGYQTIVIHLAQQGYIVAMPEHSGNNRNNNALADSDVNLIQRPRHGRMTIDAVMDAFPDRVDASRIAVIGHSMGGYTALAMAGGQPWSASFSRLPVERDSRVKALVLMAPATPWFLAPESLRDLSAPILLYSGELDEMTPLSHADTVIRGVPDATRVTHRIIPGAGHFSFLSPFPSAMRTPQLPPANDPPGFDRAQFHQHLPLEIQQYLDAQWR